MRLSRFSDLSLRALMYLGTHPDRWISSGELAERMSVSRDHLMKTLQSLSDAGHVQSKRGREGGFTLADSAGAVRIGALVRTLEPSLAMAECFEPGSTCPLTPDCRLADALAEAQRSFFECLDRYTLADLLRANRPQLVQLGGPTR